MGLRETNTRAWPAARRLGSFALAAVVLGLSAQPIEAQSSDSKLDRQLRWKAERAERRGDDNSPASVIIKVRPGARQGLLQRLRALGATVSSDFTLIDATAAELSPRQLRRLAQDKDVLSISADAEINADGIASTVSGVAQQGAYSLRSTLGLRAVSATTTTTSFHQGNANGYLGVTDTGVDLAAPTTTYGSSSSVYVEGFGSTPAGMLVRFDNLFGTGAGQIPPGSTITSASLRIRQLDASSSSASFQLYRMRAAWDATSTWNGMTLSGAGLQFDNLEVAASPDATVAVASVASTRTFSSNALAAAVQAWANGQPNHGWVVFLNSSTYLRTSTSEDLTLANRPLLTVTYRAPVNTTSLTGNGVTIAVLDSGLYEDGGGTTRIKTTRDFTTGLASPAHIAPVDAYGHGTHIAGLIGGNKAEVEGVAPGVKFVSLRVLSGLGSGSTSNAIKAIQWAVANKATYGIDILNLSFGHPVYEAAATDPLVQAVESAVRAGITVVVAAGNIGIGVNGQVGYGGITSPGNAPSAITVGASRTLATTTRQDDLVSDFSSRGPSWYDGFAKPDLVAPGQYMLAPANASQTLYAAFPMQRGHSFGGRAYLNLSGTSMAAGVVSGTVALMIEQAKLSFGVKPSSHALKAMLQRSAFPLTNASGVPYDVLTQGAGALNAHGAAQLAGALDPRVAVGFNWVAGTIPLTTTVDQQVISWSDNIVWGTNILWGDSLNTRLTAWSDNIVWGTSDNIVWGTSLSSHTSQDNIVWGTNSHWVDNIVWGTSDNIVWGTNDNIVWGTYDDNIVWGTNDDNIVWGTSTLSTGQP